MEKALSFLTILPISKEDRAGFVARAKEEILSGDYNPLHIEAVLKGIEETIKAIRGDREIREAVISEIEKHPKGEVSIYRAKFNLTDRKTWIYDACNDPVYDETKAAIEEAKEAMKQREKFLQSIPEGGVADPDTGAIIQPATFYTNQVLTVKL